MSYLFGLLTNVSIGASVFGGGILLAVYLLQDKLLYNPDMPSGTRTHFLKPSMYHINHWQENFIKTEDGEMLQTWFIHQPENYEKVPTLLFFHGNAGNISYRLPNILKLISIVGVNVFIVSYRGYGTSTGYPSESGFSYDSQAALDYLLSRKDIDSEKLILFGRSLGGAVAIDLAYRNPHAFKGVIVENTFTSIPDIVDVLFPPLKYFKFLSKNRYLSIEKIKEMPEEPHFLFISGSRDELIPKQMMADLYENCNNKNKRLHIYDGGHNDTWLCPHYFEDIYAWVKKVIPGWDRSLVDALYFDS